MRRGPFGSLFDVSRAKTGRAAKATLSKRVEQVLLAYLASLSVELVGPIFPNRSGRPYSKDTLGDDFKAVRELVFGKEETRQLANFRRSGTVEALTGNAIPEKLSSKMANSLSRRTACIRLMVPCISCRCETPMPRGGAAGRS